MLTKSIKTLTEGVIDYAGIFPPAKLPLQKAVENYVKYTEEVYGEMLSKFICPVSGLPEFGEILKTLTYDKEIPLSLLSRSYNSNDEFNKQFDDDLNIWDNFINKFNDRISNHVFEIRLPAEIVESRNSKKVYSILSYISEDVLKKLSYPVFIFVEGETGKDWKKNIEIVIEGIKSYNENNDNNAGFKLRTGGISADQFPEADQIAFSIRECLDRAIPLKCTAGLHHPLTHYDDEIKTNMFGFLNVFIAGTIAMRHNISNAGLTEILTDESIDNFVFADEYLSWKDWKALIEDIEFARKNLMISFGSCSFEEPVEDLKSLNLL